MVFLPLVAFSGKQSTEQTDRVRQNWRILRNRILFPVSSLKDEENGITKSATGNNK